MANLPDSGFEKVLREIIKKREAETIREDPVSDEERANIRKNIKIIAEILRDRIDNHHLFF
jgi:hypothetical protein